MTDYSKLISDMEAEDDALRATQAVTPPGQLPTANFSGTPATARAVLQTQNPQQLTPTWEQMGFVEKVANGLEGGYNNLLKSRAIGTAYDRFQAEELGLSALVDDDEDEAVKELLARDTKASRDYKAKMHAQGIEAADEFAKYERKSSEYATPLAIQRAAEAGKDKGFWEGTTDALAEIAKDPLAPLDSLLYLATSSFGAIAPYVALSALGGNTTSAMGLTSAARAVSAAIMYNGSYQNEFGTYIAEKLREDGIDLKDSNALATALKSDKAQEYAEKANKRAQLVAAFDAVSGYAEMIRLNPSNAVRRVRNAMADMKATRVPGETRIGDFADALRLADTAPKTKAAKFGSGLENIGTQAMLQGVLGGAGEATGALAAGDPISWGDVLFETLGEITSAPVEVVTMTAGLQAELASQEQTAKAQQAIHEQMQKVTTVVNAISSQIPDGQTVQQWADGLGQNKVVFAFAQDLVDAGVVDALAQTNPELAESITRAAEQKSDVSIPVSEVVKMAAADKALADKVLYESRVDADGMSPHKADDFMKGEGKKEAVAAFEKIMNDAKPDIETRKEIEAEVKTIREDLVAAGTAADIADLQTRPWASWLAVRAKQTGLKPKEIMQRINLRIKREKAREGFHQQLSTAMPSDAAVAKGDYPDPKYVRQWADYEEAKKDPKFLGKVIGKLKAVPGVKGAMGRVRTPEKAVDLAVNHMADNLVWLYDHIPADVRERAKLWYVGGNLVARQWAQRYGLRLRQTAAIIAVFSPQNPWFNNMTNAERLLDIYFGARREKPDAKLAAGVRKLMEADLKKYADNPKSYLAGTGGGVPIDPKEVEGKTLEELLNEGKIRAATHWIRVYDRLHNDPYDNVLTPEGGSTGIKESNRSYFSSNQLMAAALSIIRDGSVDNIYDKIGSQFKVRDFYNNLYDPFNDNAATIDTHAVAADMLLPMSSASDAVADNFGNPGNKKSGQNGTYPFHFEAYRRAAERCGVSPREMQSITWEAVRVLFEAEKKTSLRPQLEAIWQEFDKGLITADQARERVLETSGGFSKLSWEDTPFNNTFTETYDRSTVKLYDDITQPEPEPVLTMEAAPDPHDAEAVAAWNQLTPEEKLAVTQEVVPWVLERVALQTKTHIGEPELQRGGYLGEPNYSILCRIADGGDYVRVARLLASYLRQDSVMAISQENGEGMFSSKVIRIQLPDGFTEAQIDDLYKNGIDQVRDANGERLIMGQSTAGGIMMLSVDAEHIDEIMAGLDKVTNLKWAVADAFTGFLEAYSEEEKNNAKNVAGRGSEVQSGAPAGYDPDLQSETDKRLSEAIKAKVAGRTKGRRGFSQSAVADAQDAEYLKAVESGDIDTARRMVAEKAAAMGYADAIPEQAGGWTMRTGPAPTKTVKAYKVFFVNEAAQPTTLFVGDAQPVPMGVWVDAKEGFSIVNPKNGRRYAPTFSNPNRQTADGKKKTGKTGETVPIADEATKAELVKRGYVTEKAKSVTAVAFRPGWHAGTLPYFPQGGEKREGSNYGNVHEPRQVVYEIEVAADTDYTETARSQDKARTKSGKVNARAADLDYIPRDGMYYYTTNPMLNPAEDGWVISGSIKINRAISQEECDRILAEHGKLPQEWSQGEMKLEDLGITDPEHSDAARKTLAPVTYDDNGDVIPLSRRFNPNSPSALEQSGTAAFTPDRTLIEKAVANFGTTENPDEAFYILPDGRMLDGSGRHWGLSDDEVSGRQVDHGDVSEVMGDDGADAMYGFMARTGAMRFDSTAGIASIARPPTPQQLAILERTSEGSYLALSYNTPEGRIVDDTEFDSADPEQIRSFFTRAQGLAAQGVAGAFAQRAYHGSSHSFDKFDIKYAVRSGVGYGLYFAFDRSNAEWYAYGSDGKRGGAVYTAEIPEDDQLLHGNALMSENPAKVREAARKVYEEVVLPRCEPVKASAARKEISDEFAEESISGGKDIIRELFKLITDADGKVVVKDIAAILAALEPAIRKRAEADAKKSIKEYEFDPESEDAQNLPNDLFENYSESIEEKLCDWQSRTGTADFDKLTGNGVRIMVVDRLGEKGASAAFREAGIPGMRYNNYHDGDCAVIWDNAAMEMIKELEQRAYHGTGAQFDSFTLSHVGEGAGSQVHGYGLYFSMNRRTAERYRSALVGGDYTLNGHVLTEDIYSKDAGERAAAYVLREIPEEKKGKPLSDRSVRMAALAARKRLSEEWKAGRIEDELASNVYRRLSDIATAPAENKFDYRAGEGGAVYAVDIPDSDVLLQEVATIDDQPEKVKAALKRLAFDLTMEDAERLGKNDPRDIARRKVIDVLGRGTAEARDAYSWLLQYTGDARGASQLLDLYGIKGMEYFDQRDGNCACVWDEKAIKMRRTLDQDAYHGSPYTFDKFTLDHIGAGEGAQAHGWGLYFALNRKTAEGYRDALTRTSNGKYSDETWYVDGMWADPQSDAGLSWQMAVSIILGLDLSEGRVTQDRKLTPDEIRMVIDETLDVLYHPEKERYGFDLLFSEDEDEIADIAAQLNEARSRADTMDINWAGYEDAPGKVYDVSIPEDDVMLREDRPLKAQPQGVQDAVKAAVREAQDVTAGAESGELAEWAQELLDDFRTSDTEGMPHVIEAVEQMLRARDKKLTSAKAMKKSLEDAIMADAEETYNEDREGNDDNGITAEEIADNLRDLLDGPLKGLATSARRTGFVADVDGMTGKDIYSLLDKLTGSDKNASMLLLKHGLKGIRYNGYIDGECAVVWDEDAIRIKEKLEQDKQESTQPTSQTRGSFLPQNAADVGAGQGGVLTLMQCADKSTFLHESAHAWLDADTMLAQDIAEKALRGEKLTSGEQAFLTNLGGFFRWGQQEGVINLGVQEGDLASVARAVQQWAKLDIGQQRGMHELFAEGFESYLLEGVSPNPEMKTIFGRFKKWLMDIYAQATRQPHPISPEVRKLYDLMFATEQQVQDTQQKLGLRALFDGQLGTQLGMTPDEMAAYQALNEAATQEAEGLVAKAVHGVMRIFGRVRREEARRILQEHREAVAERQAAILEEPRYCALEILTHGWTDQNGNRVQVKISHRALVASGLDEATIHAIDSRGWMNKTGGMTLQWLADTVHTSDVPGLVGDLLELNSLADAKEEAIRQVAYQEKLEMGDVTKFNDLRANLAAYNETRSRFLVAEYNALARAGGSRQLMVQAAREYAVEKIGGMRLSEIYPNAYMNAERRCSKLAEEAVRKGDFAAALEAKRGQILNHEMARAALEAQDRFERGVRMARRALKSKTIHPKFKRMIMALMDIHSVSNLTADERKAYALPEVNAEEMKGWAEELLEAGTPIEGLDAFLGSREHAREMTAYDSEDYFSVLKQLQAVGRAYLRQKLAEELGRIDEVVERAKEELHEAADEQGRPEMPNQRRPMTRMERWKDTVARFLIDHVKIASWCRIFDQNKDGGLFWEIFIRSANDRAAFENSKRQEITQRLADEFASVFKKNQDEDPIAVPGFEAPFTHGMRLAVALNMGNESNRQRLIGGDPRFAENNALGIIMEHLTEADWRAVEAVWKLFEELRPLIGEKEERVFGIQPKWIDYKPFEVTTAEGKKIRVSGGYYPVKFDERATNKVDKRTDAEAVQQEMKGAFQSATTRRSFTKSRVDEVKGMPLRLDLSALYEGFNDVIHDLAWHEWLIETKRILDGVRGDGSGLRAAIKERYGYNVAKQFDEWRTDIAQGGRDVQGSQIAKFTRNVGVATMGYSVTSAVVQVTGVGYVIPRVGVAAFSTALAKTLANPMRLRREINKQSEAMRLRAITMNREISQVRNQLEQGRSWLRDHAYTMMVTVQTLVDTIAWQAAYDRFTREGYSGDKLIAMCDQTVVDTQSGGNIHELSKIERDPGIKRIFTVFYSWANAALNMEVCEALGESNRAKALGKILFMGCFMPVLEDAWREMIKAKGDDDDDDEALKLLRESLGAVVEYHLGLLVGAREVANTAKSLIAGEPVFSYSGPAGVRALVNANNIVQAAADPLSWKGLRAAIDLSGSLAGLPSTQINRTIKGVRAVVSGDAEGLDAVKAPVFGYSGKIHE